MEQMEVTAWNADVECSMGRPSRNAKVTIAQTARMGVCVLSLMADQSWWKGIPPSLEKLHSILHTPLGRLWDPDSLISHFPTQLHKERYVAAIKL